MISPSERERFKSVVGSQYITDVSSALNERGITNRKGKPYSKSAISMVVQGDRDNPAIEDVIRSFIPVEQ